MKSNSRVRVKNNPRLEYQRISQNTNNINEKVLTSFGKR